MALKSYHKETLNDNWYEERSEPLNGVLPDDRVREYSTTSSVDLANPKSTPIRAKARMVNERSLGQALLQSAGADISLGFRSSLPRPNEEQERRYLETTQQATFGRCSTNSAKTPEATHRPAGGPGGLRVERGKSTSGAAGEVFKMNPEPQRDTASQRAWLYSADPLISTMKERTAQTSSNQHVPTAHQSTGSYASDNETRFRRKSTSITSVPLNHQGVFIDD